MTKPPIAVVVGSSLNALGVVRSLGGEAREIIVVDAAPGGSAIHSRYAKPHLFERGTSLLENLIAFGRTFSEPPILFLTHEADVALVSSNRDSLQKLYRFAMPPQSVLADLMDKNRFQELALKLGFPVPRSAVLTPKDGAAPASDLIFPCILKPVAKNDMWERKHRKAYRFETFADLEKFCRDVEDSAPAMIVQEWIEGGDSDVYFTLVYRDETGKTCASFTGRKIRQWPPLVGGTASCVSAPEVDEALSDMTRRFFDAVGFVGMGSMEYKRDRRTGRFVMVEPTVGRSDFQEEVSTINGVNIAAAAYRSVAGLPPRPVASGTTKRVWLETTSDIRSRQAQPDATDPEGLDGAPRIDGLFRWTDLGPWLADLKERLRARLGLNRR